MAATTCRIKITKEDLQLEAEGDRTFVLEMLNRFENNISATAAKPTKANKTAGKPLQSESDHVNKQLSISEFVRRLGIKKHTEIVLSFGYYLEKYSGVTKFTPADINKCYYDAKMESSNTSQMIIQNIRRSYIMQAKSDHGENTAKKGYVLTKSGEEFIDNKLAKIEQ